MQTEAEKIVESLLNEGNSVQEDSNLFVTPITNVDKIDFVGDRRELIESANISVTWKPDMDYRSWGLKGIEIGIHSVTGSLGVEGYTEPAEGGEGEDTQREISLEGFRHEARIEPRESGDFSLYPRGLEINESQRTVVVLF